MHTRDRYIPIGETKKKIFKATGLSYSQVNVITAAYIGFVIRKIKLTGRPVHIRGFGTFKLNKRGVAMENKYRVYLKKRKVDSDNKRMTPKKEIMKKIRAAKL